MCAPTETQEDCTTWVDALQRALTPRPAPTEESLALEEELQPKSESESEPKSESEPESKHEAKHETKPQPDPESGPEAEPFPTMTDGLPTPPRTPRFPTQVTQVDSHQHQASRALDPNVELAVHSSLYGRQPLNHIPMHSLTHSIRSYTHPSHAASSPN